jgi:methyl-accepting chemotaxis protein
MRDFFQAVLESEHLWVAVTALAAVGSAVVALAEARARTKDAKQYAKALDAVINAGQYVIHLRGMEERMTSLNSKFEQLGSVIYSVSEHMKETATASREMVDLATTHIESALGNIERATSAVNNISQSLTDIANAARRSQRDSVRAHSELMKELTAQKTLDGSRGGHPPEGT